MGTSLDLPLGVSPGPMVRSVSASTTGATPPPGADSPALTEALRAALRHLHERLGFALWLVARMEKDRAIVIEAEDHGYGVRTGHEFAWADALCRSLAAMPAPTFLASTDAAAGWVPGGLPIGAFVGAPLRTHAGEFLGALCAIDPASQPESIGAELPLVQTCATLIARLLEAQTTIAAQTRRAECAEAAAMIDPLTGLYNRRAWELLVEAEERRCRRGGRPAAVAVIDIDDLKAVNDTAGHGAGDALIVGAAQVLRSACRAEDVVARLGGDEFALLAVDCDADSVAILEQRLRAAMSNANLNASLGIAGRRAGGGLAAAFEEADASMLCEKAHRKRRRTAA